MKEDFLSIKDHSSLANFFGMNYQKLASIIYPKGNRPKYRTFFIPKKNGETRQIDAPHLKLKRIQKRLSCALGEIYSPRSEVHGFTPNRSISSNASVHVKGKVLLNIDLKDFFGTISFGRVRNLFKSHPFNFDDKVSAILAQICCLNQRLPQGSPVSPILTNMICMKMDRMLKEICTKNRCSYTRYADDMSISFTCSQLRLPKDIVKIDGDSIILGEKLVGIIEKNGFSINPSKTRLRSSYQRQDVTGLIANEFVNVRRDYVRRISSILYSWKKFGKEAAEEHYNNEYCRNHFASKKGKDIEAVVRGMLAFYAGVRGKDNPLFKKLAIRYNELACKKIIIPSDKKPEDALWILEACFDNGDDVICNQGTGFNLEHYGIITCAHVVTDEHTGQPLEQIEAYKHLNPRNKFKIKIERLCNLRDLALLSISEPPLDLRKETEIQLANDEINVTEDVFILGYPNYAPSNMHSHIKATAITKTRYIDTRIFEVSVNLREGNSGGPAINSESKLVGVAMRGEKGGSGKNGCIDLCEIQEFLSEVNQASAS